MEQGVQAANGGRCRSTKSTTGRSTGEQRVGSLCSQSGHQDQLQINPPRVYSVLQGPTARDSTRSMHKGAIRSTHIRLSDPQAAGRGDQRQFSPDVLQVTQRCAQSRPPVRVHIPMERSGPRYRQSIDIAHDKTRAGHMGGSELGRGARAGSAVRHGRVPGAGNSSTGSVATGTAPRGCVVNKIVRCEGQQSRHRVSHTHKGGQPVWPTNDTDRSRCHKASTSSARSEIASGEWASRSAAMAVHISGGDEDFPNATGSNNDSSGVQERVHHGSVGGGSVGGGHSDGVTPQESRDNEAVLHGSDPIARTTNPESSTALRSINRAQSSADSTRLHKRATDGVEAVKPPPPSTYTWVQNIPGVYQLPALQPARCGAATERQSMRLHRPVAGFAAAQNLPLDPITVDTLDIHRLVKLFPVLAPVLAVIGDVTVFESLFVGGRPKRMHPHRSRRLRKGVDKDLQQLLGPRSLLTEAARHRVRLWVHLFKVPKDEVLARLIVNAVPVNELMRAPPRLYLVTPWQVVRMAARHTHHATFDFRHWFYQFPLHVLVSLYFGVRRHDGSAVAFTRLPMGWSWSMWIACFVIETLTRALKKAVESVPCRSYRVDIPTFVDGGDVMSCEKGGQLTVAALLLLCHHLRITLNFKKSALRMSRQAEFIGLLLDDERRAYHLVHKWQDRLHEWYRHKASVGAWTWRDILLLTGSIIWGWYALRLPFSKLRPMFAIVAWAVKADKATWDDPAAFTPGPEFDGWIQPILDDIWMPYPEARRHVFAETDATPWSWGHVITSAFRDIRSVCYGYFKRELVIHIAEMVGAIITIGHVAALFPHSVLVLGIDNEVTRYVLLKGHSPVDALNSLAAEADALCRDADLILVPVRVDTDNNLADEPSRRLRDVAAVGVEHREDPGLSCIGYRARALYRSGEST